MRGRGLTPGGMCALHPVGQVEMPQVQVEMRQVQLACSPTGQRHASGLF